MRKLFSVLLWIVLVIVFLSCSTVGGFVGAAICTAILASLCWKLWKRHVRKEAELSGGFDAYASALTGLTDKELVKICVIEQLQKNPNPGIVAKETVSLRLGYTAVYCLVNFFVLRASYATGNAIWQMSLITMIYFLLMLSGSTVSVLYRKAKSNPLVDFEKLVQENTYTNYPVKKVIYGGAAVFLAVLVGFFALHSEEKWKFTKYEDGYMVVSYQPSALGNEEVVVPKKYKGKPVLAIGKQAFANLGTLKEIELPKGILSIGSGAFKNCKNLEEISLPDSLEELQGEAFMDCRELEEIEIPEGVTAIRGNTFDGCRKLEEVELHDEITEIHAFAFRNCAALEEIELPSQITEIREQTFAGCKSLRSIRIPEGVTRIAARAFFDCTELEEVEVPDSLNKIGSSAFRQCKSLKEIELPEHTSVEERAFKDSPTEIIRQD